MSFALIHRLHRPFVSALFLVLLCAGAANADFQVSIGSGTIDAGGELLLEIGIESDGAPQNLAEFELILQITPMTFTGGTSLRFVDPQSEAVLDDADYVFATTSDVIAADDTAVAANTGNTIVFSDLSIVGIDPVNVPVTSGQLLATIDVEHLLGGASAAETADDQFVIAVDELNTFFADANGFEILFSATSGVVTVGAVAIPEPSSVALLLFASCGLVIRRRR